MPNLRLAPLHSRWIVCLRTPHPQTPSRLPIQAIPPVQTALPTESGAAKSNSDKNRYLDILPYDSTRVKVALIVAGVATHPLLSPPFPSSLHLCSYS